VLRTGFLFFVLVSLGQTQSVIWGLARVPLIMSPQFLLALCAMSFELSRDLLNSARLARQLRESEQRLELAAGAAGLGVWILDATSRSVNATDKARAIYGLPDRGRVRLQQWLRAVHPDDVVGLRRQIRRAFKTGMDVVTEHRVRLPDGGVRWVAAHVRSQRGADRKLTMVHGVLRDVTEERRARDETEQLRRELTHTGRVTMLGQLSAALAHELNQPLTAILSNAQAGARFLAEPFPNIAEVREVLQDIAHDTKHAGEVIRQLRTLIKKEDLRLDELKLNQLIQDVVRLLHSDALIRKVEIELDFDGDLYDQELELTLVEKLRNVHGFPSVEALKEQIQRDIVRTRELLR
jgi:PAS domain S-box-containing protein